MADKRTWPNARLTHHEAMNAKESWKYWKINVSTSAYISSLPLLCIQQTGLLDCDVLVHYEGFHPEMESNILIHWCGDHELFYYNVVIQC